MRRLPVISLDPMKFLQAFAAGLRAEFADAGLMDGIDLAREVRLRWPFLPVILTSGHPLEGQLPLGVDFMPKPWQLLNLLVAAKQALASL